MTNENAAAREDTDTDAATEISPIEVFYEAAAKQLEIQIGAFNALDAKAWNALSIGSAILPITFGLLGVSDVDIPLLGAVALGLAVVAYAILLWHAWRITSRTDRLRAGEPITTLSNFVDTREFSGEGLQLWLTRGYERATIANEDTLLRKAIYVGRASNALYAESLFLSIAAILILILG
jgi:hypothetical protein